MLLKRSAIVDMTQILCENKDYNIFPQPRLIHLMSLSYVGGETIRFVCADSYLGSCAL